MNYTNVLDRARRSAFGNIVFALAIVCGLCIPAIAIEGKIGVGTWATQAEFKDIKVVKADQTLFAGDWSKGIDANWIRTRGKWEIVDGALRQSGNEEHACLYIGDSSWSDYTLTLKARKISGNEGFLISFGVTDTNAKSWWNIGGWGNTQHALQSPGVASTAVAGKIETGKWYDIKIESKGNTINAYLDDQLIQSATQSPASHDFGHALIPDLVADPSIAEFDGTFYCFATTDGMGAGLSTAGLPVAWKSKDLLNWSFSGSIFPKNFDAKYWAPSAPVRRDGKYYLFPTLNNKITATVADAVDGPYRALDGKEIANGTGWQFYPLAVGNPIDAEVFIDDDGSAYMIWSQRAIGKLKPDFSGFEEKPVVIRTKRGGYSEGPCIIKRNGVYYYLYTLEGNENYKYAYMTSRTSPMGPWEAPEQDIIARTDAEQGVFGPGHGCFFSPKGSEQWYFVYLEYGRAGTNRQVFADKMNFNPDGTIQPITVTKKGVGAITVDPQYAKPNLALGATATASSTMPDRRIPANADSRLNRVELFTPANALDESNGSRWMAKDDDRAAWYQLDLGKETEINRTELYFAKPTAGHAYRLESSLDGKTWKPFGGHDELVVQSPHVAAKTARVRYLKVTILKGVPGLWEFRVY